MNVRQQLDRGFERLGYFVVDRAALVVGACLLAVAGLASNLPSVEFDTSTESFLHDDDPTLIAYNAFRDQFGRDELVLITLQPERIWDAGFLTMLRELHDELETGVPHVDEITSLVNARATRGSEGELLVEDLMEEWPETPEALANIQAYAEGNQSYENRLLSANGRITAIVIKTNQYSDTGTDLDIEAGFDTPDDTDGAAGLEEEPVYLTDAENEAVVEAVEAIVEPYRGRGTEILVAGSPVVMRDVKLSMQRNMLLFVRITLLAIAVLLFALFRRVSAVVVSLIVVIMSLVSTISLMAATGTSLKLPTMILPSFILAVGVGDSVHILSLFFRALDSGTSKRDAIAGALEHSGLPVTLTSLTTAGGLLSFAPAVLAPIADLGLFAPAGVMMAWAFSLLLLPALLAVAPLRSRPLPAQPDVEVDSYTPHDRLDRVLARCAAIASTHSRRVIFAGVGVIVVSLALASTVRFSHNPVEWLPEWSQARSATEQMDREMRGSITVEALLVREGENAWYEPDALKAAELAGERLEAIEHPVVFIGNAFSVVNVLKEIHRALNENHDDFYVIPDSRELIAQEFLLFENSGSDDLEDLVDNQFSMLRMTLKAPFVDSVEYTEVLGDVEDILGKTLPSETEIRLTGVAPLLFRTMTAVNVTMVRSYVIAFGVITVLMILVIGSVKLGIVAMFPNLLPIAMAMAVMGVFSFPLDTFTLMIASISLGLAVDDTIHFMHNYRRYQRETGDSAEAIRRTLATTGRALLFTTLVLASGFAIFMFSSMSNVFNFGLLTSFAIIMALLADILLAPALMHAIHHKD
ncbi:MAG: MMPL family transporter [Myxococcota bacterium]|nr:MMPL family transporter [Myxococcota bacterium]